MGDCGSLFVGFLIAFFALKLCNLPIDNKGTISPVFILCVISFPSIDTLRVFFLRIINKKSPFIADKNHIHHFLIRKNFQHLWISYYAISFTLILVVFCYFLRSNHTIAFFTILISSILFIKLSLSHQFISLLKIYEKR